MGTKNKNDQDFCTICETVGHLRRGLRIRGSGDLRMVREGGGVLPL